MEKKIIGLGLLAGALAGSASFLYARTQIAPLIAEAISYEEARSHAAAGGEHAHEHEVFSRAVQENIGAGVGTIMFAIITGALFAVAVSIALATLQRHRVVDLVANARLDLKWIGDALERVRGALEPAYVAEVEEAIMRLKGHVAAAEHDARAVDADAFQQAKEALDRLSVRVHEVAIARSLADFP